MNVPQFLDGKSIVQLICALIIALTSVLHADAAFASKVDAATLSFSQDGDLGTPEKAIPDRCDFCSGTVSTARIVTVPDRAPVRQAVPSIPARPLVTANLPTVAPPPRA